MRILFTLIVCINAALGFSQEAVFFLNESTFKFPKTNEGAVLEHTFVFTNSGNTPLIISSFSVACTCTKVEFSKEPVSPGKTGMVKITFDTNGKYYLQDREILLTVNTKKKIQKLRFKVFVIPKGE